MRKNVFIALLLGVFLFSCSQDSIETDQDIEIADLNVQKNNWKEAVISSTIIENQKNISHYEFDVIALQNLIDNIDVTYVWFDLGLNVNKQITFTATGVNSNDDIIGQVTSIIIANGKNKTDITILQNVKERKTGYPMKLTHMLPNKEAYEYLINVYDSYRNFETALNYDGERVRRFGLETVIVKRMLATNNASTIALFLGLNKNQKITTVFIAKDVKGYLLIDDSNDLKTSGRAFDVTRPCPNQCDPVPDTCPTEYVCVEECSIFGFTFCCEYYCPGDDTGDQ